MAVIHVLDKHTAELIAAGEVVERPASVVKELTENAIDAGATAVTVSIQRGGVALIEIADNGSGIDPEYIPTAFVRHATSKITAAEDLDSIHTLGFRGEALASIASVARIELLTKTEQDEFACLYRIAGGQEEGLEAAARPIGTTITVRDLFFNTPARMKFLKKDTSEANYVSDIVGQLALSHPEVSFKFIRDGKVQFQTPGDGALRGAAYAVLSRDFAKDLIEVQHLANNYVVSGLVTPPKSARGSRSMQHFFINGRFVKNRTMMAALEAAYKGTVMQNKFPGCVLNLQMPPQLVDVNVHPAKTEVRFAYEKEVFDLVYQAVKSVLLAPESTERAFAFAAPAPAIQSRPASATQQIAHAAPMTQPFAAQMQTPTHQKQEAAKPAVPLAAKPVQAVPASYTPAQVKPVAQQIKQYNGILETLASDSALPYETAVAQPVELPLETIKAQLPREPITQSLEQTTLAPIVEQETFATESEPLRFVGEVFHAYIVTQRGNDICFIDKHAAHERILYESLVASYGSVSSQMLLCPVTVQLSADEKNALLQQESLLADSGLELEDFGGNSVVVRAVPADVEPDSIEDLVLELASRLIHNPRDTVSEKTEWVLHSIACRAAVKAGDKTHAQQLLQLATDVLDGKVPPFCPHGRPVILKVTKKELEKQFGRQG